MEVKYISAETTLGGLDPTQQAKSSSKKEKWMVGCDMMWVVQWGSKCPDRAPASGGRRNRGGGRGDEQRTEREKDRRPVIRKSGRGARMGNVK